MLKYAIMPYNDAYKNKLYSQFYNAATYYANQGKYKHAITYFKKALKHFKEAQTYYQLGIVYEKLNQDKDAEACWIKAVEINPNFPEPMSKLGVFYLSQDKPKTAITYFKKILKLLPTNSATYNNIGLAYRDNKKFETAIRCFKKSIEFDKNDTEAHYNLGLIYEYRGNYNMAKVYFEKALKRNPYLGPALSIYTNLMFQTCDWNKLNKVEKRINNLTLEQHKSNILISEAPFVNILRTQDQQLNLIVAKSRSEEIKTSIAGNIKPYLFTKTKSQKRLKIGYLSSDFCNHATAFLIANLFSTHNKKKFESFVYSYSPNDNGLYIKKIKAEADHFVDISTYSHIEAANKIYSDKIDILVDLKGHTRNTRLEILALKPSPIQVSWLGYPGTTGADFIDYIITDKIVTPPSYQKYYTEKFAYLPTCYQINDNKREIANIQYSRDEWGLPRNAFVFCCFNQNSKINKETFTSWVKILKKTPNSILWLYRSNKFAEVNLKKEAKKAGIKPERLIFADSLENSKHLARIRLSDLALDTFTYNGHTTTSDCLWAGVPVVTLQGNHFASRVASSILTAAGLPELITKSQKEYENLAIELATNPKKLAAIHKSLILNHKSCPLFDTQEFVRNLERIYEKMYQTYTCDDKPRPIK